jgi:Chitobiase/beta-hexosaminidase C-terminal domain/Secretion system C-terminal sorting domain
VTSQALSVRVIAGTCTSAVSTPVEVVVNPVPLTPLIQPQGPTSFCEGGSVVLKSSSASGNLWSNGATTQEITVNHSGDFTVQTIASGCSSAISQTVSVDVKSNPVVAAGPDQTIGSGQSVTLTATGADTYQWSPLTGLNPANGFGTSVIASPANTTRYIVTGTSTNGCQAADSVLVTVNSVLQPLTPPVISPATGSYTGPVTVTITAVTGSNIFFTTNGNVPRVDVPNGFTRLYTGPFQVSSNTTIRAIAVRGSEVTSVKAVFLTLTNPTVCDPPVLSPGTGTYTSIQTVTMTTATAGADIWYTTNGNLPLFTTPNSFTRKYTGPFQVDHTTTINAVTTKAGVQNSSNVRAVFTINLAQNIGPVVFSPSPGIYSLLTAVSMSCNVADAQIYFSTNGNTPRIDIFNYFTRLYSTPVAISTNTTFKAMGVKTGLVNGPITTGFYTISAPARMATDEPELGLFPNPARDKVYLNLFAGDGSEGQLTVFDLQGRQWLQFTMPSNGSQQEIDVRNLPSGQYLIRMTTGNRQIIRQFVKE